MHLTCFISLLVFDRRFMLWFTYPILIISFPSLLCIGRFRYDCCLAHQGLFGGIDYGYWVSSQPSCPRRALT